MTQIWGRHGKRLYAGNPVSQQGWGMKYRRSELPNFQKVARAGMKAALKDTQE